MLILHLFYLLLIALPRQNPGPNKLAQPPLLPLFCPLYKLEIWIFIFKFFSLIAQLIFSLWTHRLQLNLFMEEGICLHHGLVLGFSESPVDCCTLLCKQGIQGFVFAHTAEVLIAIKVLFFYALLKPQAFRISESACPLSFQIACCM